MSTNALHITIYFGKCTHHQTISRSWQAKSSQLLIWNMNIHHEHIYTYVCSPSDNTSADSSLLLGALLNNGCDALVIQFLPLLQVCARQPQLEILVLQHLLKILPQRFLFALKLLRLIPAPVSPNAFKPPVQLFDMLITYLEKPQQSFKTCRREMYLGSSCTDTSKAQTKWRLRKCMAAWEGHVYILHSFVSTPQPVWNTAETAKVFADSPCQKFMRLSWQIGVSTWRRCTWGCPTGWAPVWKCHLCGRRHRPIRHTPAISDTKSDIAFLSREHLGGSKLDPSLTIPKASGTESNHPSEQQSTLQSEIVTP